MNAPHVDLAIAKDPLVQEWFRDAQDQAQRGKGRTTDSALLAAGEQLVTALTVLRAGRLRPEQGRGDEIPVESRQWLADSIASAACYWVPADIDRLLLSYPLPRHKVGRRDLPHPRMWICPELAHGPDDWTVDSILLTTGRMSDGREALLYWMLGDGQILGSAIPWGATYPDEVPHGSFSDVVLKFLAFIDSPYTASLPASFGRSDRRRLAKSGREEPLVHVARLRSAARQAVKSEEQSRLSNRAYAHRWWVSGHFRAQWYPSLQAHRVVWIAPYVKGPEDKPFKGSVYAVVR